MRVHGLAIAVVTIAGGGCSLVAGLADFDVSTSIGGAGGSTGVDMATGAGPTGGGDGPTGGADAVGGAGNEGGGGDQGQPPANCAAVVGPTGIHKIDPDGEGGNAAFSAWCEMTIAAGGWTLVGRSAPGGNGPFGWMVDVGLVTDTANPYSLDVERVKLVFDTVLLLASAINQAYTITVPPSFVASHLTIPFGTGGSITAMGGCAPMGGAPSMLRYIGHTALTEAYFLRDISTVDAFVYGLRPDGFHVLYPDCDDGGDLHNQPGAIFVR
jgi:hypothetical protein